MIEASFGRVSRTFLFALALATGCGKCGSLRPGKSDASSATPSEDASAVDAARPAVDSGGPDAAWGLDQRTAYATALREGRKLTTAKSYEPAIAAFSRALDAIPADPRALAERGYAKLLKGDADAAIDDLELARSSCPPKDKKLAAQIEFNLGLASDALADAGRGDQWRGAAVGHYRRSNDLSPSKAAAAKAGGCPAAWGAPDVKTYASVAEATAKSSGEGEWEKLDDTGTLSRSSDGGTELLLPLDGSRVALVAVGPTMAWRCGAVGEVHVVKRAEVWRVEYQAHVGASTYVCWCDGVMCGDDGCKCAEPLCQSVCGGGSDEPGGDHEELYIDAHNGAGVWHVKADHAYLKDLSLDVDLVARRFHTTGLGCIADVPLLGK